MRIFVHYADKIYVSKDQTPEEAIPALGPATSGGVKIDLDDGSTLLLPNAAAERCAFILTSDE